LYVLCVFNNLYKMEYLKKIDKIPTRLNIGVMLFFACALSYMMRVNVSINILAMVHNTSKPENDTGVESKTINTEKDVSFKYKIKIHLDVVNILFKFIK